MSMPAQIYRLEGGVMKRYARTLGLAVVVALLVMTLVGASSAAASGKVCSTSGTGSACAGSHGKVYSGTISASLIANTAGEKLAVLTSGFIRSTCTGSSLGGIVSNGATATGTITGLTFTTCHNNLGPRSCTLATNAATAKWAATGTASGKADGNGTLDVTDPFWEFACEEVPFVGTATCKYTAASASFEVSGSDTAPTVEANAVPLTKQAGSSSSCSTTASWDARYQVTTPTSLFLT